MLYGPTGSGKKTRIQALLKRIYGSSVDKVSNLMQLKIEERQFTTPSNKKIDLNIVSSNYHIEITPRSVFINSAMLAFTTSS
jgi:replication factor C subunit 3/5